jgi:tetratricopeptide (TPR) repeat protein
LANRSDLYKQLNQEGPAYLDLAEARLYEGNYDEARDNLEKALPFVERDNDLMLRAREIHGGLLCMSADYEGALEDLNASIAGRPTTMAFYWRSLVYEALGEYQKAQQDMAMYNRLY